MTSTRPKSKKIGKTITTIKGKAGKWEIFSYVKNNKTYYANRLVSSNGWIVCSNLGFLRLQHAIDNVSRVRKLA